MNPPDMAQVYSEYSGKVMGYIRARVSSYHDAQDLCADVFEKIQLKLPTYDSEKAALSTWIFTITRNTVIDFFRKSRPQSELDENQPAESEIDEKLLNNETLSELAHALEKLPMQLRQIVVMRYYDGKPLTEIAEEMNLSYGAVKLRHMNALELLRQNMGIAG